MKKSLVNDRNDNSMKYFLLFSPGAGAQTFSEIIR